MPNAIRIHEPGGPEVMHPQTSNAACAIATSRIRLIRPKATRSFIECLTHPSDAVRSVRSAAMPTAPASTAPPGLDQVGGTIPLMHMM